MEINPSLVVLRKILWPAQTLDKPNSELFKRIAYNCLTRSTQMQVPEV